MKLECFAFAMGTFFCKAEDGRLFFGKRDPATKEILSISEMNPIQKMLIESTDIENMVKNRMEIDRWDG